MADAAVAARSPAAPLDWLARLFQRHEKAVLAVGLGLQFAVLVAMIAQRLLLLSTGVTYFVRVVPVDPRDLLRGDYVILSYEFSRVSDSNPGPIYVTLEPAGDGKHSRPGMYLRTPPAGQPYIKGEVTGFGRADYGIESYFVQEGKGHAYEDAVRAGQLTAEIAVTDDGRAALKRLHIERK
jgi:uncharacterized membrane-anchored protein